MELAHIHQIKLKIMIHLIPYDGLGYTYHFFVGVVIFFLFRKRPFLQILIGITLLAIGKEIFDIFTDGAIDIWDVFFSIIGVLAGRGGAEIRIRPAKTKQSI